MLTDPSQYIPSVSYMLASLITYHGMAYVDIIRFIARRHQANNLSKVQDMDDFQTSALLLRKKRQTAENAAVINEDRSLQRRFFGDARLWP